MPLELTSRIQNEMVLGSAHRPPGCPGAADRQGHGMPLLGGKIDRVAVFSIEVDIVFQRVIDLFQRDGLIS